MVRVPFYYLRHNYKIVVFVLLVRSPLDIVTVKYNNINKKKTMIE